MKEKKELEKFYFVEVHPHPCTPAELNTHLLAFGKAFVGSKLIGRWNHVTQEKPDKAKNELAKIVSEIDKKFQTLVDGSKAFPDSLEKRCGRQLGVYFDGIEEPCKVTSMEASTLAAERDEDAIFSIIPGTLAIFFYHGGDVILLEKN